MCGLYIILKLWPVSFSENKFPLLFCLLLNNISQWERGQEGRWVYTKVTKPTGHWKSDLRVSRQALAGSENTGRGVGSRGEVSSAWPTPGSRTSYLCCFQTLSAFLGQASQCVVTTLPGRHPLAGRSLPAPDAVAFSKTAKNVMEREKGACVGSLSKGCLQPVYGDLGKRWRGERKSREREEREG